MDEKKLNSQDFNWNFWSLVPIYPYGKRRTIRREIVKDSVWTFEQLQGIFYVIVPIRMSVVKLDGGGLLVYAPVAPTGECLSLLQEIIEEHGEVKYIILPTISGVEHKVFVAPFARKFPRAIVYVAPDQWSFPLNLPLSWLGLPKSRTKILSRDIDYPLGEQFEIAILDTIDLRLGYFSEVAIFDKKSQSLLLTDSIVSIPENPPLINQIDPYPLLFHSQDSALESAIDSFENRQKGWQRICLFAMYFQPTVLSIPSWGKVFSNAIEAKEKSRKNYFGLFPFQWSDSWQQCFNTLRGNGRLFVAPILQTLILNRSPKETLIWVDRIASWNFNKIISCHFDAPINANDRDFRQAFNFLKESSESNFNLLPEADLKVLKTIDRLLYKSLIIPPPQVDKY